MKILKQIILALIIMLLANVTLMAQGSNTVTGTVTDIQGEPLPGVTLAIQGTTQGGFTNVDGEFIISVDPEMGEAVKLNVTFIGFIPQTVDAAVGSEIVIVLKEDVQLLDELIVVGYDTQKKTHLTGSVSKMEVAGIENVPTSRADQLLQGRVAGVQIQNTTSEVGVESEINIRGVGSISASSQPLIIVDGFPIDDGLGVVDAEDIASIEVLKDAASAAIYGSRAANGVILVTTKSGSLNKPKYSIKSSFGVKGYHDLHPVMTREEYVNIKTNEYQLMGITELQPQAFAMSVVENSNDWQSLAMREALFQKTSFSVSGGKEEVKYYISTSYLTDEGIMKNNSYDKFNLRSKLDVNLSERVKLGTSMSAGYSKRDRPTVNFTDFYRTPSFMPLRHTAQTAALTGYDEGEFAHGFHFNDVAYVGIDPISGLERTVVTSPYTTSNNNPASRMENEWRTQDKYTVQSSIFLQVELLDNFYFKTSNGFNLRYQEEEEFAPEGSSKVGSTSESFYNNELYTSLLSENTFTYKKRFQKHDLNALLGFSAQTIALKSAGIYGIDFATDYISTLNAAGSILQYEDDQIATGTWEERSSMASLFSRFMYAYDDKYLLSTSIRTDGSSKFGEQNRWGWFPSVSVGWRVTEEDVVKDAVSWLSDLKVRTSYGVTGTDNIDNYVNVDLLNTASYALGGEVVSGIANNSTTLGNNALQWEQTNEYNSGFDLYLFDSRLGVIFDAYYSITKSLLYERSVNSISGYTEAWSNEGKVRNKGIEFTVTSYNIKNKDFSWSTSLNFAHNDNILLDLGGPQELISQGERNEMYIARVGDPLIQFYGYETDGIWLSQDEIDNNPSYNGDTPGGLRTVDQNSDGTVNADDFVPTGSPYPDFTWGVSNRFSFKGADLSFLLQGSQGGQLWNGDGYYNETKRYNKNYALGRWVNADNIGDGETPYENNGINHLLTDYLIQDASYFALKDLSVGYTFDDDVLKKIGMKSFRVYASFQNLWYHTNSDYKGINIEARNTSSQYESPLISGYQRGSYPTQRTYSFGLELTF